MTSDCRVINKIIELCQSVDIPTPHHQYDVEKRILGDLLSAKAFPADSRSYDIAIHAFDLAFFGKEAA